MYATARQRLLPVVTAEAGLRYDNLSKDILLAPELAEESVFLAPDRGSSKGVEFYLKRDTGTRFAWWGSYALARSRELIEGKHVPMNQDQRHTIYLHFGISTGNTAVYPLSWERSISTTAKTCATSCPAPPSSSTESWYPCRMPPKTGSPCCRPSGSTGNSEAVSALPSRQAHRHLRARSHLRLDAELAIVRLHDVVGGNQFQLIPALPLSSTATPPSLLGAPPLVVVAPPPRRRRGSAVLACGQAPACPPPGRSHRRSPSPVSPPACPRG